MPLTPPALIPKGPLFYGIAMTLPVLTHRCHCCLLSLSVNRNSSAGRDGGGQPGRVVCIWVDRTTPGICQARPVRLGARGARLTWRRAAPSRSRPPLTPARRTVPHAQNGRRPMLTTMRMHRSGLRGCKVVPLSANRFSQ